VTRSFERELQSRAKLISECLVRSLDRHDDDFETLWDAMRYSATAPGKRIRPILTLEFCKLMGGSEEDAMPFALAVECMHVASLVHDDMPCMDDDDYRRGRLTNHKVYGEGTALLCGDALLTYAYELAIRHAKMSAVTRLHAVRMLAEKSGPAGMMGGQMMDMEPEAAGHAGLNRLRKLQMLKTGRLIELAAHLGCLAAGVYPDRHVNAYNAASAYAGYIGAAFQIIDDILDVTGDSAQTGKTTGQDAKNKKVTFVTLLGAESARAEAEKMTNAAKAALHKFGTPETRGFLTQLADELLNRKK
jgi:geranylgeranyl diphosphate synthase type II